MKTLYRFALCLLLSMSIAACGKSNDLTWTEDVKLPDGRVLTLTRWVEFNGPYAMGDTPTESRQRLEFKHPETGEIVKWENAKKPGLLDTVGLWLDQGKPMLLGKPAYGDDSHRYNCPNPPYLLFEFEAGKWQSRSLSQIPISQIRANITFNPKERREGIEANKRHLTAAQTLDSYTYREGVHKVPYVIKFEGMPVQTFENQNCSLGPNINKLLFTEGK